MVLSLFGNYLTQPQPRVVSNDQISKYYEIGASVPQGSDLDLIL